MQVTCKVLQLLLSKINIEKLEKLDIISIAKYQCNYALLLILILHIFTDMKTTDNNQKLHFNEEEAGLELGDALFQKILEDHEVNMDRNYILIAIVAFCILYYTKNQHCNILQVTENTMLILTTDSNAY